MKTLRWKPLKSSVKQARSLTGILETINILISGLFVVAALFGLLSGQILAGLAFIPLAIITYLILKISYIALELLTEIADDTRLQLMAVAADEYDHNEAQNIENLVKSGATKDDLEAAKVYNAAAKGYRKIGGEVCGFDESTVVSIKEVIL